MFFAEFAIDSEGSLFGHHNMLVLFEINISSEGKLAVLELIVSIVAFDLFLVAEYDVHHRFSYFPHKHLEYESAKQCSVWLDYGHVESLLDGIHL